MDKQSDLLKQFNLYTEFNAETQKLEILAIAETSDGKFNIRRKEWSVPK